MTRHLIHIGFPKTGTTWLQSWFAAHPGIAFDPHQFLGLASVYRLVEHAIDQRQDMPRVTSCEDFAAPSQDHREWPGMAAAQAAVCETLHRLFPDAHILIITRGFRGIIESGHAELVRFGRAQRYDEFISSPEIQALLPQILDYDRLIALYRQRFAGRVTVLPYELLRSDPGRFIERIADLLGVARHAAPDEPLNPRLSDAELRWYPLIARAIAKMPVGRVLQRKMTTAHVLAMRSGRLRGLAGLADRIIPRRTSARPELAQEVQMALANGSAQLVKEESHRDYAGEYQL